jgi:ribosomal protein S4
MGIAPSRRGARQIVFSPYRHVTVNGEVVNTTFLHHLRPGDKVAVRENLSH